MLCSLCFGRSRVKTQPLISLFSRRFQLYYFSDAEMKKDEYRETILTIDTRGSNPLNGVNAAEAAADTEFDEQPTPALENAIQTK